MKKSYLYLVFVFLLNLVSAYGEGAGQYIAGLYVDTDIVFIAVAFIIVFFVISFGTSRMKKMPIFKNETTRVLISLILTIFTLYGLTKIGVSFENIFADIGLDKIIRTFLPWIILISLGILMWLYGIGTIFMFLGGIFVFCSLTGIFQNKMNGFIIGGVLLLIGMLLNKKFRWKIRLREKVSATNNPRDLQKEYNYYSSEIQKIQRNWKGKIPPRGTPDGEYRAKCYQSMKVIENEARKRGISLH